MCVCARAHPLVSAGREPSGRAEPSLPSTPRWACSPPEWVLRLSRHARTLDACRGQGPVRLPSEVHLPLEKAGKGSRVGGPGRGLTVGSSPCLPPLCVCCVVCVVCVCVCVMCVLSCVCSVCCVSGVYCVVCVLYVLCSVCCAVCGVVWVCVCMVCVVCSVWCVWYV